MVTPEHTQLTDKTRLTDLTVGELKALIQEIVEDVVQQAVLELTQQLPDPDEELKFKPEIAERMQKFLAEKPHSIPAEQVMKELGLDE
jgi:hypothetical protein